MTLHISGAVVTHHGVANNNRGENEGNMTTLQKLLWNGEVHTTVSAEAIRWAVRYLWQQRGLTVRRRWDDDKEDYDERNNFSPDDFLDDDLMGFMLAEGAKMEGNDAEKPQKGAKGKKEDKPKGTIEKRRGVFEVARAVSLLPYAGDVAFNAKAGEKGSTSLYAAEIHATRYQYGFALTPARLKVKARALEALRAVASLGEVAGNHARYLYDFSPETVVFRVSHDPSPRLLYCFDQVGERVRAQKLVRAVEVGDIAPAELIIGGALADVECGQRLEAAGVTVRRGVQAALTALEARLAGELS
jgi:CRISPR-associated protein Cst2